jgi:hypothetical protein
MILLDFIYYYLNLFFTARKETLGWTTPGKRSAYSLALITLSWIMSISFFLLINVFDNKSIGGTYLYVLIPVGLGLIALYEYIYITKERIKLIEESEIKLFHLNPYVGISIAWIILFLSFMSPFAILILNLIAQK